MASGCIFAHSRLDIDTVSVSSEDAAFPKSGLSDDRPFVLYRPASVVAPVDIKTASGSSVAVDYLVILGHDLFTRGASFSFSYSDDDVTYVDIIASTAATDNKIICRKFASVSHKYFRLRISGASGIFSIGQVQWGVACQFPYSQEWKGFDPTEEKLHSVSNKSQTGQILGAVATHSDRRADIQLRFMPFAWTHGASVGHLGEFWTNHGRQRKPFVFSWNPGNPGNFEKDAFWCCMESAPERQLATPIDIGLRDVSFSVIGPGE